MSTVAIIFRRPNENNVIHFSQIITSRASKSQNLCQFKAVKTSPLFSTSNQLLMSSDIDLIMQFFRDNDLAQLKNFKLKDFYQQEAIDISRYLMKVGIKNNLKSSSNFFSSFQQFRKEIWKLSQNPCLGLAE
jgi:hypothetical protein